MYIEAYIPPIVKEDEAESFREEPRTTTEDDLRPDLQEGPITPDEVEKITRFHEKLENRWNPAAKVTTSRPTRVGLIERSVGIWHRELDEEVVQFIGGSKTNDRTIQFGHSICKGRGNELEDKLAAKTGDYQNRKQMLFGVRDGCGKSECMLDHLLHTIRESQDFERETKVAIRKGFSRIGELILESEHNAQGAYSTAILVDSKLFIACMGDTCITLSRGGEVIQVSGVNDGNLVGSRIFSWIASKIRSCEKENPLVLKEDDIKEYDVSDIDYIVLGSKGLTGTIDKNDIMKIAQKMEVPEAAATMLVDLAYKMGSKKNISCIVVKLNQATQETEHDLSKKLVVQIEDREEEKEKKAAVKEKRVKKIEEEEKKLEKMEAKFREVYRLQTTWGIALLVTMMGGAMISGSFTNSTSKITEEKIPTKKWEYSLLVWGYIGIVSSVIASVSLNYVPYNEKRRKYHWLGVTLAKGLFLSGIMLAYAGFVDKYHHYHL